MNPIFLSIILIPILEIYLLIKIGSSIGAITTILLIFTTAIIGIYYAKYEGLNTLKSGFIQLSKNQAPTYEVISGAAIAFAALLLIIPGFATDLLGFLLIFPASRNLVFNIFSKNLLRFINIPVSLGSYGLDDTFVMMAANYMKQKGYDINQFVLEGLVCIENNRYTLYDYNPYKNFLEDKSFSNKGREFKKHSKEKSHINFNNELKKFIDKL